MSRTYAFWDTSVLVSLCAAQPLTTHALRLFNKYRIVVWWATPVEMTGAFVRLLRNGGIDPQTYAQLTQEAQAFAKQWAVVAPSAEVAIKARAQLEQYPLRAADSLQLAAALIWCDDHPKGRVFLTFDKRLREAAEQAGFTLE